MMTRLLVSLIVATSLIGCALRTDKTKATIRWEEPFDLDHATFYIDGSRVGSGMVAFDRVMKRLAGLQRGADLKIQFPAKWSVMRLDGKAGDMWEFPFEGHLDKEEEFTKLCGELSLVMSFETIK